MLDYFDSDSDKESVIVIPSSMEKAKTLQKAKHRSWVYEHSEKLERNGVSFFHCRCEFRNGRKCEFKVKTKQGQTSVIANHLREKHGLKPPTKMVQATLAFDDNMPKKKKPKTFRQSFAELVCKQYLPYSIVDEKVLQDSYLAFLRENKTNAIQPVFVTRITVAADIARMAEEYIAEMKTRFQSKISET